MGLLAKIDAMAISQAGETVETWCSADVSAPPPPILAPAAPEEQPAAACSADHFSGPPNLDRICSALEAATEISIDLETTHLTPWAAPIAAGKSARIGTGQTINQYVHANDGCEIDERPRARIVAIETDNGLVAAVDLDRLDADQKTRLVRAAARPEAVWVGHNLGFDLQWLNHLVPGARPGRIIDTMLMTTALRSDVEYDVIQRVVGAPDETDGIIGDMRAAVGKRVNRSAGSGADDAGAVSLDLLALHFLNQKLDKGFQKPINWMPSILSDGHLKYVLDDIHSPRLIARRMMGLPDAAPISAVLKAIDAHPGGPAYKIFERAVPRLVQMQATGLRIDPEAAAEYRIKLVSKLTEAVDKLIGMASGLEPFRDVLLDPSQGLTADLKTAVASAFEAATGEPCPTTEKSGEPQLGGKELVLHYGQAEIIQAWLAARSPGKTIAMLDEYLARRDENDRLHPLTSIATLTGRTSSQEPNLQNAPRDPAFRAVFRSLRDAIAKALGIEPTKMIAADFSAVEMRIAACLALRAYSAIVRADFRLPKWIMKSAPPQFHTVMAAIRSGRPAMPLVPSSWPLPEPAHGAEAVGPEAYGAWYASRFAVTLARLQQLGCALKPDAASLLADRHKMALAGAFHRGLDPHLVTAIQTESRAGRFDMGGAANALIYVESLPPERRKDLKSALKKPRTAAKALNFGLLYGMSAAGLHASGITKYDLDWTLNEAAQSRAAWFELYPEIELWQLYLKLFEANEKRPVRKYGKIVTDGGAKLYRHSTLSGRPVCGPEMRNAGNYSDQGTNAEIGLAAIAELPDWLAERLVDFVHDELLFEVEESRAEEAKAEIERVMNGAADALFEKYGVPSEVETEIGDYWIH